METRKLIGITFINIAVISSILFSIEENLTLDIKNYFDFSFKSYFSIAFLRRITPLILCFILLYGGFLLLLKPLKSNTVLALFGFTVIEEIVFHWFGIMTIDFSAFIIGLFFCCAILCLFIAYSNQINLKRLSIKEGLSSLLFGTLINAFTFYF
jgi:hypothetical protein